MGQGGGQHLERPPRRHTVVAGLVPRARPCRPRCARLGQAAGRPRQPAPCPLQHRDRPADHPPRRRRPGEALYRLLYETAARAEEILTLDIEDLELPTRQARVKAKGARARTRRLGKHEPCEDGQVEGQAARRASRVSSYRRRNCPRPDDTP